MTFRMMKYGMLGIASLVAAATYTPQDAFARSKHTTRERPSCTVSIHSVNVAFIGGGGGGEGVLNCGGKKRAFTIGGGGIGSIGASEMRASGSVYRLDNPSDFEGVYGQVRAGGAVGPKGGEVLMLENEHGVIMRLKAKSRGLSLSLGGEAMIVKFK
ncbi:hypothetical protein WJT86_10395 [Microvirga sp. W0021]|uniref:Uncharacterized protein n=1 Tax=Hohaiivirga grylli TaxID=3133970 RepID=A0ABV0BL87_9HYPH